jgi:hypothetical protein
MSLNVPVIHILFSERLNKVDHYSTLKKLASSSRTRVKSFYYQWYKYVHAIIINEVINPLKLYITSEVNSMLLIVNQIHVICDL